MLNVATPMKLRAEEFDGNRSLIDYLLRFRPKYVLMAMDLALSTSISKARTQTPRPDGLLHSA